MYLYYYSSKLSAHETFLQKNYSQGFPVFFMPANLTAVLLSLLIKYIKN